MRNWPLTLRPASFRGVPFHVDEESIPKSGRRIAVHKWVKAESHGTEDFGRLPRAFRIKAYVASDAADTEGRALIEACSAKGAATLVLPFWGGHQVRCETFGGSWNKDRLGYLGIELEFVEAGRDQSGFPAIPIGDRITASVLDRLSGLVSEALSALPF